MGKVRKPVIAGSWYPGDASVLRDDINRYMQNVPDRELEGDVTALIVPHAGYIYSGQVAAYAYKLLLGKRYDSVILVGPSHRVAFGGVSIYSEGGYETPLGVVPVDESLADRIKSYSSIMVDFPAAHAQEHSLEIQLPFLQVVLGDFSFVPLVMGDQGAETCLALADAVFQEAKDQHILIVASSDLSHFHGYKEAKALDGIVTRYIQDNDVKGLLESLAFDKTEACGGGPIAVAMMTSQKLGARHSLLLKYANSGDVTGDKRSVVGYASAVYYR
ncbi:MAG: AmmeMemoRadiSam system protein B [Smithellaceae bacterium]|jgi:AmmeMemoRadiSam system protein B|nr:AmmeMemoRadiSam system protein B [Smithellaceae bacterium]